MDKDFPPRVYGPAQQGSQLQLCPIQIFVVRGNSQSGKNGYRGARDVRNIGKGDSRGGYGVTHSGSRHHHVMLYLRDPK